MSFFRLACQENALFSLLMNPLAVFDTSEMHWATLKRSLDHLGGRKTNIDLRNFFSFPSLERNGSFARERARDLKFSLAGEEKQKVLDSVNISYLVS